MSYFKRAFDKEKKGDYSGAIADYTKAIEINPTYYVDPYINRAGAKYELNDYSGAIDDLNRAIELSPKNKDAYFNRGFAKLELDKKNFLRFVFTNRLKSACADWREAYSLGEEAALDVLENFSNRCNINN